jgi:hypothetical protein
MRYLFAFAQSLIALTLLVGTATAQQNSGPPTPPNSLPTPQQSPPSVTPQQQRGVDDAIKSESGKAGTQEPSSAAVQNQSDQAALMNGAWNVSGAPKDSQTAPSKFSKRNAALDQLAILAWPIGFTDAQRKTILGSVREGNARIIKLDAKLTEELQSTVELFDFSSAIHSEMPAMNDLKYVRLEDKILLVYAPNWIVVGEIRN